MYGRCPAPQPTSAEELPGSRFLLGSCRMASGCLFCNIVARTTPAQIVFENEHVLAFRDIRPMAPTHALVIPKTHIVGVHEATAEDAQTLAQLLLAARDVAEKLGLATGG